MTLDPQKCDTLFLPINAQFGHGDPSNGSHRKSIEKIEDSPDYNISIREAIQIARRTLNRYYSLTDSSEVYRISMILHPRYKLTYFTSAGWTTDWKRAAETIVRREFEHYMAIIEAEDEEGRNDGSVAAIGNDDADESDNCFEKLLLPPPRPSDQRSELDRYLASDVESVVDALAWWNDKRDIYPRLSRMALDYLSIPATSVDVERIFSRGRLLLSHTQSQLSTQTTRAVFCVGQWSKLKLVKSEDVHSVSKMKDEEGDDERALEDGWDMITLNKP